MNSKCPTCQAPRPQLHPAVQNEGEVQSCTDPWHQPRVVGKEVQKWADSAMYEAEPTPTDGPKVHLLWMTPDPLGAIAAACLMYTGKVIRDLSEVSDADRKKYLAEVMKTHLKAPLEFVQFHFMIDGVTRAFTHQMIRQRTATYAQESLRFAVKEDMPVGLPPSLAGTTGEMMRIRWDIINKYGELTRYHDANPADHPDYPREYHPSWLEWMQRTEDVSRLERQRYRWDLKVERMRDDYLAAIDDGMPAEEARGLLPHNVLTRLHYRTDLRSLLEHAGNRLCTQAQFEWRLVFSRLAEAIRQAYHPGIQQTVNFHNVGSKTVSQIMPVHMADQIADLFRPICYMTGKCEFMAEFDRACSIRDRVQENAVVGRPSSQWDKPYTGCDHGDQIPGVDFPPGGKPDVLITPILPAEWLLDPGAAR